MKNAIHLTLFCFKLHIKTQGKYHLPFLPASQPSVRCCKIVTDGLSKFISFLQRNRTIDWNAVTTHWCKPTQKASFNFLYVPVFTLCCFSGEFWKGSKIFSLFFFQVARVLPGILNWFATSFLDLTFQVLLIFRTWLSKSFHDASFLWPFLSHQLPIIKFKQI